jgi:hypothetical protein
MNQFQSSGNHFSVGLFWFSPDYISIIEVRGKRELKLSDLSSNNRIDPIGLHAEHDMPRDYPRGRICLENGIFTIWAGEDCPIDPTPLVKNTFGLNDMEDSKFKVKKHYHWNTKIL